MTTEIHAVTGAFGYSGKYIAKRLLEQEHRVVTLTNSTQRENSFGDRLVAHPFNFEHPEALARSLADVSVLYNTYWVRFNAKSFTHQMAIRNTRILFQAAKEARVERIVHVSITNPALDSPLEYFAGKALLEADLAALGVPYAILRPTVLFGKEDVLVNNIAWFLRRLPVFGVFGDGRYLIQPIFVDDLAALAVEQGAARNNVIVNAVGPETYTFKEMVQLIAGAIGKPRPIVRTPPRFAHAVATLFGRALGDVTVTRAEVDGLMAGLLHVTTPPTGKTRLSTWVRDHADTLGNRYANEMKRRCDRRAAY